MNGLAVVRNGKLDSLNHTDEAIGDLWVLEGCFLNGGRPHSPIFFDGEGGPNVSVHSLSARTELRFMSQQGVFGFVGIDWRGVACAGCKDRKNERDQESHFHDS